MKQVSPTMEDFLEYLEQRTYLLETTHAPTSKPFMKNVARVSTRSSSYVSAK